MTTIISQDAVFAAVDELWTDEYDLPAPAPFKKFYVLNDSILFFSGFINPILAVLASYVGDKLGIDEDYANLMAQSSEMDDLSCSIIEVERKSGRVVYEQGATKFHAHDGIFYGAGSGCEYALNSFIDSLGIILSSGKSYDFECHGKNLIDLSMKSAFNRDCCSGGEVAFITWDAAQTCRDYLNWVPATQLNDYHDQILANITERFENKESLLEMITMLIDEEKQDAQEYEIEAKIFDQDDERGYSPKTNLAAKGISGMSNTTNQKPRTAVKTSGSSQGKVLSASSLKARIEQRKAEGLS